MRIRRRRLIIGAGIVALIAAVSIGINHWPKQAPREPEADRNSGARQAQSEVIPLPKLEAREHRILGSEWSGEKRRILNLALAVLEDAEFDAQNRFILDRIQQLQIVKIPAGDRMQGWAAAVADLQSRERMLLNDRLITAQGFFDLAVSLMHEGDHLVFAPAGLKGLAAEGAEDMRKWYAEERRVHSRDLERVEQLQAWAMGADAPDADKEIWLLQLEVTGLRADFSGLYYSLRDSHLTVLEAITKKHNRFVREGKTKTPEAERLFSLLEVADFFLQATDPDDWANGSALLAGFAEDVLENLELFEPGDREAVQDAARYIVNHAAELAEAHRRVLSIRN